MKTSILTGICIACMHTFLFAQHLTLLQDIHTEPMNGSANPHDYFVLNNQLYYFCNGQEGYGLFLMKTDLTVSGTVIIKQIQPYASASSVDFEVINNQVVFAAGENDFGNELWTSDGTPGGTFLLQDINPGAYGSQIAFLGAINGTAYFKASQNSSGDELWKTDGTASGTLLVKDIHPGTDGSNPQAACVLNNTLFFVANDGTHGYEIWKSDGTASGTLLVSDFNTGSSDGISFPYQLVAYDGKIFFGADDGQKDCLAETDPAGTTAFLTTYFTNDGGTVERFFVSPDDKLYISVKTLTYGSEPWLSDGTGSGTGLLKDTWPGVGNCFATNFFAYNGYVFFRGNSNTAGNELWQTDGTQAGTNVYANICPGGDPSYPMGFVECNGAIFFKAQPSNINNSYELYTFSGNNAPVPVADLDANTTDEVRNMPFAFGNRVVFAGRTNANGVELYVTDGTAPGTTQIVDWVKRVTDDSPKNLATIGNTLYFTADTHSDLELWSATSSPGSAAEIKDILNGNSSMPSGFFPVGNKVLFQANSFVDGVELFQTDGTPGGTSLLKDLNLGPNSSSPENFVSFTAGSAFFLAQDAGQNLFTTDGTAQGTYPISQDYAANLVAGPSGYVYLSVDNGITGEELYYYTNNFLIPASEINPGPDGSYPHEITLLNSNTMVFCAYTDAVGQELFACDVPTGNTSLLKDIYPGSGESSPHSLFANNGLIYFTAYTANEGTELWVTDGTPSGTVLLKDIFPGSGSGRPENFTALGNSVVFTATDPATGCELWITDGTPGGTQLLKDLVPGIASSLPRELVSAGNFVVFSAYHPLHGIELWQTDGTAGGTYMLEDLSPAYGSYPRELNISGNTLFFTAFHESTGREIYTFDLQTLKLEPLVYGSLEVYPNPVTDVLHVSLSDLVSDKVSVTLVSLDGKTVWQRLQPINNQLIEIPVQDLTPGMYLIRIEAEGKFYSGRFIKP